jgi:hypothetical protein
VADGKPVQIAELFFEHPGTEQDVTCAAELLDHLALPGGPTGGFFEQRPTGVLDELRGGILTHSADGLGRETLAAWRAVFHSARRTSSSAWLASLTTWEGSAQTRTCGARAQVTRA